MLQRLGHNWETFTSLHFKLNYTKYKSKFGTFQGIFLLFIRVKAMVFSSTYAWMLELDYKESWALKNWCFWTVVLEKTLESPLDCMEIQLVHPKGNLSWMFIGRTDVEAENPIFWPPDVKSWHIWKDPDAGKDWRWKEKGMTEDKMVEWHHRLNGHEFE